MPLSDPILEKKVVSTWWEGVDLLVENEDGTVTRYMDAYVSSHNIMYPPGSCVENEDLQVEFVDIQVEDLEVVAP